MALIGTASVATKKIYVDNPDNIFTKSKIEQCSNIRSRYGIEFRWYLTIVKKEGFDHIYVFC